MNGHTPTRRALLRGGVALGALGLTRSQLWASAAPTPSGKSLVLLQLTGGNDGLSTVVPWADDAYGRARRATRIAADDVLRLDEGVGLHPELTRLRARFDAGQLAVVQGAGYPDPIRSHFRSYEVWHTARRAGRASGDGWIGRLAEAAWREDTNPNLIVHVGPNVPYSVQSRTHPAASFSTPTGYRWAGDEAELETYSELGERMGGSLGPDPAEAEETGSNLDFLRRVLADAHASSQRVRRAAARYRPTVAYPADALGASLRDVAALLRSDVGCRVYSVELGGFDTHSEQRGRHDTLMRRLDEALGAFLADLDGTPTANQVIVLVFSEFGRRVQENGSRGTDHGVAGPMFVAGQPVRGGLFGAAPSLEALDEGGDLVHTTDFRSVYATLIQRWFGVEPRAVLGEEFSQLDLL